ncbi:unnamed protein product [marine sediment metagenome]|uniref:Type I restriction modification DNA specificity domain-containing protein n=1 Tax=marine sediment metagenome TaxID=412755 RepID=X1FKE0_9ZZZZ
MRQKRMDALFDVVSGDFHATRELDPGPIPLISCGDVDNGLVGYFDIPADKTYRNCVTVAYNGQPLTSKFHPYVFGAKDDVAVLLPRQEMPDTTLTYVAAMLNVMMWRYSYGRKCFREKLRNVRLPIPMRERGVGEQIDHDSVARLFPSALRRVLADRKDSGPRSFARLMERIRSAMVGTAR